MLTAPVKQNGTPRPYESGERTIEEQEYHSQIVALLGGGWKMAVCARNTASLAPCILAIVLGKLWMCCCTHNRRWYAPDSPCRCDLWSGTGCISTAAC